MLFMKYTSYESLGMVKYMCYFLVLLLFSFPFLFSVPRSKFTPRAENTNLAQDFIMRGYDLPKILDNETIFEFIQGLSYHHSFKDSHIADMLFGNSQFTVSGSNVEGRKVSDFLADFFGLSQTFESDVNIKPTITAAKWLSMITYNSCENNFVRFYFPFVVATYNIGISEIIKSTTNSLFGAGYMGINTVQPQKSFIQALEHPESYGNVAALKYGKLQKKHTRSGLAEFRVEIGHIFCTMLFPYFAVYALCSIPTGNKAGSTFLFSPICGNRKHIEVGLCFSGHTPILESAIRTIRIHAAANITTLIKHHEKRNFDLKKNGILSRYLPVKIFNPENKQPTGNATPLINITNLYCSVRNNIQMDAILACTGSFNYKVFSVGYNAFLKSRDVVNIQEEFAENTYGIKGIQNLFDGSRPDSFTQSTATIFGTLFENQEEVRDPVPVFVKNKDIEKSSGEMPFQLTHKFFASFSWSPSSCINNIFLAFLTIGAEIEFEGFNVENEINPSKSTLNQAGIFASLRIEF